MELGWLEVDFAEILVRNFAADGVCRRIQFILDV
jgi:hypothetical protein